MYNRYEIFGYNKDDITVMPNAFDVYKTIIYLKMLTGEKIHSMLDL